jgi:starch synthase
MAEIPMKLLMVASEAAPFAKTGGLADVVGSLPPALHELGHDVRLVMPWYRCVTAVTGELPRSAHALRVPVGGEAREVAWRSIERRGVTVYFIDCPRLYGREGLYGEHGVDYPDNAERFALLSRAALELARLVGFTADVVHAHDWQAGLVPVYLHHNLADDPFFASTGSLFSIHNLGYQGIFPIELAPALDIEPQLLTPDGLEYYGSISLLKGAIRCAGQVNTVSPTYCREIQTEALGMGFDGILRSRGADLHGILNGIDPRLWSPQTDRALPATYKAQDLTGKGRCKQALQRELGLPERADTPLAAMVTRLDPQKGIELLLEEWDAVLEHELQLVILGSGSPELEARLTEAAAFYPDRVRVQLRFDDRLARRIYAGSDLFLMPSRYEPCGLGQLIALRYGSVPLVHATGGLADTVSDYQQSAESANGFRFSPYSRAGMLAAIERALALYHDKPAWQRLLCHGMSQDLSWATAAGAYEQLYRRCTRKRR